MSIALRGITKSFQGVTVIPPLTIEFSSRAFTTLLGPSGCGKTTLLRMIAGLETPDAGEILFDGKPVFSADLGLNLPPEKRNIGFVFQDFALWPHLTVFENVAFPLRARKDLSDLESKVTDALSLVGLADFAAGAFRNSQADSSSGSVLPAQSFHAPTLFSLTNRSLRLTLSCVKPCAAKLNESPVPWP